MLSGATIPAQNDMRERLWHVINNDAIKLRDAVLASGLSASIYVDCRQIYMRGEAQFIIGELLFRCMLEFETLSPRFDACGGMATGCIPLSSALTAAAFRRGRELPGFFVRSEAKAHGMNALIEGDSCLTPRCRVVIVEDVVTTGASALKAIQLLRERGVIVDTVLAIVDREHSAHQSFAQADVQLYSLFKLSEFFKKDS